ncbi:hypothetical protein T10_257 [Trichinella papuae]|uniref:Uncharacterized protein n=1 Tax=Trichinella papuae TaxID=268474 RepID=A0A0V1N7W5_9BILA|nr:hypothetical protein T10_257 [Trichinella papuae]
MALMMLPNNQNHALPAFTCNSFATSAGLFFNFNNNYISIKIIKFKHFGILKLSYPDHNQNATLQQNIEISTFQFKYHIVKRGVRFRMCQFIGQY